MGKTISEKIFSKKAGNDVKAGEFVIAKVDFVFGTDTNTSAAIEYFEKLGRDKVFNNSKIAFTFDNLSPSPTSSAANIHNEIKKFVGKYSLKLFADGEGICHQLIPESGYIVPGDLVVGTDSHTVTHGALNAFCTGFGSSDIAVVMALGKSWFQVPETIRVNINGKLNNMTESKDIILYLISKVGTDGAIYKTFEFGGDGIFDLEIEERMTISNMSVEAGAKAGIMEGDNKLIDWIKERSSRKFELVFPDNNARYLDIININADELEPLIALPHSPGNVDKVKNIKGIKVDQVMIGYCTNGRMVDFRKVARILKGKHIHPNVRLIIAPTSRNIYKQMIKEGLAEIFIDSGAIITSPGCGACAGYHSGVLGDGEVALSTTNRNFIGRMGNNKAKIYLSSTVTAAVSAITGVITDPRDFKEE